MKLSRILPRAAGVAALIGAVTALTAAGTPDVTRARLEASLAPTFANLYVQQAGILGVSGLTVENIDASAVCDRGGPNVADTGSGSDWICMITFHDVNRALQVGKFEVQVRADSTYVAGGPSRLIGLLTITDKTGRDVPNPVFEFDGAFDPNS
jgi:hypothetical protein